MVLRLFDLSISSYGLVWGFSEHGYVHLGSIDTSNFLSFWTNTSISFNNDPIL
jgi:hypothetical protein